MTFTVISYPLLTGVSIELHSLDVVHLPYVPRVRGTDGQQTTKHVLVASS